MKNIIVAVVSSEKTYERLDNMLFNDNFLKNRDKFDLAVVFNSSYEIEKKFKTNFDYIFYRENTGLDLGGFNYLIKNLGDYEYYFLLHDDSYYLYDNWVDYSIQLLKDNPEVDIIGNILFNALNKNEIKIFEKLIEQFNYNHLLQYSTINHLIHGVTGIFSHNAIDRLRKKYGSIPYINNKDKFLAMLCERLTTIMFIDCGIKYAQYPGDIYMYLAHSTENELILIFLKELNIIIIKITI
ncbi:MAG TPA: hypothetical protein PLI27_00480 [Ignavibacteriales bacterium]|nr:hypothetical protein [Ignavibacteriales bacterium]HRT99603.1 hypothetical protein [Ignavibacteriales bacterium]